MTVTQAIDFGAILNTEEAQQDPYPTYARMRAEAPVVWSETLRAWLVTRYDDVQAILSDHDSFGNPGGMRRAAFLRLPEDIQERLPHIRSHLFDGALVNSDPPTHSRHRLHVNRPLTPRAIAARRSWMESVCADAVEKLPGRPTADLVNDYALPVALAAVGGIFGATPEMAAIAQRIEYVMRVWFQSPIEVVLEFEQGLAEFVVATSEQLAKLRDHPDDGVLSAMVNAEDPLRDDEIVKIVQQTVGAAGSAAGDGTATTLYMLLQDSELMAQVRSDLDATLRVMEETLRFHPPVLLDQREARKDVVLGGVQIAAGEILHASIGSANRDPDHFADPDRFDPARNTGGHLSFGHGVHYCIGAGLTRQLVPVVINTLLGQFPNLRLAAVAKPRWRAECLRHRLESLEVVLA